MLTRAHFQYLKLENEVTIEVLAGRLTEREADHKLRSARQVLGYLSEQSTQQHGDRVSPCSRCGERRLLTHYISSDELHLLTCEACGLEAQRVAGHGFSGSITIKRVTA
jgi:hypothetical protein